MFTEIVTWILIGEFTLCALQTTLFVGIYAVCFFVERSTRVRLPRAIVKK